MKLAAHPLVVAVALGLLPPQVLDDLDASTVRVVSDRDRDGAATSDLDERLAGYDAPSAEAEPSAS